MFGRDPWGGTLEISNADSATDDDRSRDLDRGAMMRHQLDETQQSWLLAGPGDQAGKKKKKYVDIGCMVIDRKIFMWTVGLILGVGLFVGFVMMIVKLVPHKKPPPPPPDQYTLALHKALSDSTVKKSLVGGFYDAGDAIKFNYPMAWSMTMLSWTVIEYRAKYEAIGELDHVKEIIKWGTDYMLKTFNSSADTIDRIVAQVGVGDTSKGPMPNDHYCWMRPEDIDYKRPVIECHSCSDLAAEMAAALAAASIVFKDSKAYSDKLVHGAKALYKFGRLQRGRYSPNGSDQSLFYNSTSYWDEFVWGGAWMYFATGNTSYLTIATAPGMAKHAGAFWIGSPNYGVFTWDDKLPGSQVLLSRLRLFLSPGYPYEEILRTFHNQTDNVMCSYLPVFNSFNFTKGGLIQLNHGGPQPLQYVVNAAFLASLYADYLDTADTPGWYCGPNFYTTDVLRKFAKSQLDYILGKNPQKMSYVVGFGKKYPKRVHHRGASIPHNGVKYGCKGGFKWRESKKANPNILVGAMVAGPDKHDGFKDIRTNYNYTEPTLAANAGLVAALISLADIDTGRYSIDKNTIFSAVPPMFPTPPPPPSAWKP
ncbi:unnamed protein product [Triticum turgidum subsp. durum]|uniref:Endoglucanase n=1 Tax=Triticum turgidum subsp. durum TaxID=4567 RepID=A0A9R0W877_TRITD|nr:unnamed protein product [Triticum turgidum subsp. durum]